MEGLTSQLVFGFLIIVGITYLGATMIPKMFGKKNLQTSWILFYRRYLFVSTFTSRVRPKYFCKFWLYHSFIYCCIYSNRTKKRFSHIKNYTTS